MAAVRTTVFVAEDHPLYLEGILRALGARSELSLVGNAADGRDALAAIRESKPDVALLDMNLPRLSGLEILRALRLDASETRVLILSGDTEGNLVFDAIRGGAAGYIAKDASREEIGDAVIAVGRGQTVLSGAVQGVLATEVRGRGTESRPLLSPREREVILLIAEGLSGPAIAERLMIGSATVKTHTQNVYDKLGVSERAAAVAEAMRRGLLE